MSNTNTNFEMTGILLGQEVRIRKTPQEKIAIIQQTMEPGMNVSHVARLHGIQPSLLFKWKKQYQEGSLTAVAAGEEVVPASELTAALKQVRELQRLLGKKTMEVEILKEAVEYGQSRKWIAHAPLLRLVCGPKCATTAFPCGTCRKALGRFENPKSNLILLS
ncbi:transposase [[Ruminococcus] torques ATCC 27756]|uniref:Transposase n=1 Tax=[Ruminococcus] torques ATCC 27756 TaxID=411460 RepID=A5KRM3_9FIRM|nr:transposase [[Ruminococcus] torques ATCC 27756]